MPFNIENGGERGGCMASIMGMGVFYENTGVKIDAHVERVAININAHVERVAI